MDPLIEQAEDELPLVEKSSVCIFARDDLRHLQSEIDLSIAGMYIQYRLARDDPRHQLGGDRLAGLVMLRHLRKRAGVPAPGLQHLRRGLDEVTCNHSREIYQSLACIYTKQR